MKNFKKNYSFENSYVEISTQLSPYIADLEDPIFQFTANFYIHKKIFFSKEEDDFDFDPVLAMRIVGHTSDLDNDYIYATDAISESTIENYAFIKGLYERIFDSEFHGSIIDKTGTAINRWVSLEMVYVGEEFRSSSELIQAYLFEKMLIKLRKTWTQLFHDDVSIMSFTETIYVSNDNEVQQQVISMYARQNFSPALHSKKFIEDNNFFQDKEISLKDIFKMDVNNNLFGESIKNPKTIHYIGVVY